MAAAPGARYEAERARRQYDQCEPENRLVAGELETRWNARLHAVAELEPKYQREQRQGLVPLTEDEYATLHSLVSDVPMLWQAAETTMEDRKRLLRFATTDAQARALSAWISGSSSSAASAHLAERARGSGLRVLRPW